MYNLRYHIISIVAIFLALAVGVLLGAAIGGSETLRTTSNTLVTQLQKNFDDLSKERDALQADLTTSQRFSSTLAQNWMADRLADRRILLLTDAALGTSAQRADEIVKASGGKLVTLSLSDAGLGLDDEETVVAIRELLGLAPNADVEQAVLTRLVKEWTAEPLDPDADDGVVTLPAPTAPTTEAAQPFVVPSDATTPATTETDTAETTESADPSLTPVPPVTGAATPTTPTTPALPIPPVPEEDDESLSVKERELTILMEERGIFDMSGDPRTMAPIDGAINIAIDDTSYDPDQVALQIASALLGERVPTVNSQFSATDDKLIKEGQARGFPSMTGMDTTIGAYGIVALLTGAETGTYGLPGQDPYPPVPGPVETADDEDADGAA